jgi:hypothetical protein
MASDRPAPVSWTLNAWTAICWYRAKVPSTSAAMAAFILPDGSIRPAFGDYDDVRLVADHSSVPVVILDYHPNGQVTFAGERPASSLPDVYERAGAPASETSKGGSHDCGHQGPGWR